MGCGSSKLDVQETASVADMIRSRDRKLASELRSPGAAVPSFEAHDPPQTDNPAVFHVAGRELQYHPFRLSPAITVDVLLADFNRRHEERVRSSVVKRPPAPTRTPKSPTTPVSPVPGVNVLRPAIGSSTTKQSTHLFAEDEPAWCLSVDTANASTSAGQIPRPGSKTRLKKRSGGKLSWNLAPRAVEEPVSVGVPRGRDDIDELMAFRRGM